ncbi:MAG: PEP-CTERM sorting domain-containing protein [Chitinophagaceae bacterium]|nr:PEP-CTERM sorting domain-containing protein [Rubrivivax sp.]
MQKFQLSGVAAAALTALSLFATGSQAATQSVSFTHLVSSATFANPFLTGDSLLIDTLVTTETGALMQSVTFTLGAGVTSFTGGAVWQVTTAAGPGPRLTGVNIDIFNAANAIVASDTFTGTLGGFAISSFDSAITPGVYRLVATGTGVRDSVMDISLSFVPEPESILLMLAGLGAVGAAAARRKASATV